MTEQKITKDDLFTIIYTSGTTGNPKGVMLTHQNMMYNVIEVPKMVGLRKGDINLSILPVWHVFERAVDYAMIYVGAPLSYTNIRDLRDDFQKIKPTFMASAPRLWENIYLGIKNKVESAGGAKKKIFNAGYTVGTAYRRSLDYLTGNTLIQFKENPLIKIIKKLVSLIKVILLLPLNSLFGKILFSKLRGALGGRLRGTISGGGALPLHVDEFFNAIGIPIYEGYGMTECAPIIAVRQVGNIVQGTVGYTCPNSSIEIRNEKGEVVPQGEMGVVHVKGPQVMEGYYKNKEETNKALKDGWLNTGDLGFISSTGTLSLRGRAKDTIVLSGGENIEPVPIENLLVENDFINQVMVVGQDKKTLGALIWPDYPKLQEAGYKVEEGQDLNANQEIRKVFTEVIKKSISADNGFKSFERISGFQFLPKAMEVGDELTNLFKMKRNVITDKYKDLVEKIYS